MRKRKLIFGVILLSLMMSACASNSKPAGTTADTEQESTEIESTEIENTVLDETEQAESSQAESESFTESETGTHILIAYFTRLDNTDADLDTIVQGGGPYGEIGDSFANADMDAISTASISIVNGETKGNTQAVAEIIQRQTGGDMLSIQTAETYPVDYNDLIDAGGEERNNDARPELTSQIENMEDYDIVFIGFPNWWNDMPMAVYSFLEAYDFTGKTIIPFSTSAGSGFSNTVNSIKETVPGAQVEENGLHIPMREAALADTESKVEQWLSQFELWDITNN